MKTKMILGVSFSTRMIGLAVLDSTILKEYSIKLFKEAWTPAKMETLLTSLTFAIDNYNITDIVLSIPPLNFKGEPFCELWHAIILMAHKRKLSIATYTHDQLQAICGSDERMTRNSLMQSLAILYPELAVYRRREMVSKNKYYFKMFEAVGAATLYGGEPSITPE
jgi:RNase H-fold protein (predicted Holliday junction resolvase)